MDFLRLNIPYEVRGSIVKMEERKKERKEERKTGKRRERKKEIREEWGNILLFLFYFEKHCIFITMQIKLM